MKHWHEYRIKAWANFDEKNNIWTVGIYPRGDIKDVWYEIRFDSSGEILNKGQGMGV